MHAYCALKYMALSKNAEFKTESKYNQYLIFTSYCHFPFINVTLNDIRLSIFQRYKMSSSWIIFTISSMAFRTVFVLWGENA